MSQIICISMLKKVKVCILWCLFTTDYIIPKALYNLTYNFPAHALSPVPFLCEGEPPPPISTPGGIQATRLPLAAVNLLGMHIIPPLTINPGTHFTYLQRDGGLSQPPAQVESGVGIKPWTCHMMVHCCTN